MDAQEKQYQSIREKMIGALDEDELDKILASYLMNPGYEARIVMRASDDVREQRGWNRD